MTRDEDQQGLSPTQRPLPLFPDCPEGPGIQGEHPGQEVLNLGIGDWTLPLGPAVLTAMERAVMELGSAETFRGYGEEQGYAFLRQAVCRYYAAKGVELAESEVFIGDGAKSDMGNILDLFAPESTVLIPDPVYPAYLDTNIMAGRSVKFLAGSRKTASCPCLRLICAPISSTSAHPTTPPGVSTAGNS